MTQKIYNHHDGVRMDVDCIEFLDIGDKLINANGEWVVEGKIVTIDRQPKEEPKYSYRYIFKRQ